MCFVIFLNKISYLSLKVDEKHHKNMQEQPKSGWLLFIMIGFVVKCGEATLNRIQVTKSAPLKCFSQEKGMEYTFQVHFQHRFLS